MLQEITLIGRLGRDPVMRHTSTGTPVTNFSLATSREYTNGSGELVEEVTWWKVTAWRRQAETANEHLSKGDTVRVRGTMNGNREAKGTSRGVQKVQIEPNIWQGQDGEYRCQFEITAQHVLFLDTSGGTGRGAAPEDPDMPDVVGSGEEEVPF
jgi:single-strand DNA-binding protein